MARVVRGEARQLVVGGRGNVDPGGGRDVSAPSREEIVDARRDRALSQRNAHAPHPPLQRRRGGCVPGRWGCSAVSPPGLTL